MPFSTDASRLDPSFIKRHILKLPSSQHKSNLDIYAVPQDFGLFGRDSSCPKVNFKMTEVTVTPPTGIFAWRMLIELFSHHRTSA